MKNIIWFLLLTLFVASCYEDKGNYTYHDINQLEITGVDSVYKVDQFDSLHIKPDFKGTQYDQEDLFEYQWEINHKVVGNTKNLACQITAPLGSNACRLMVTDKDLGTSTFCDFQIYVSSSTASDAIVVLSNYKGQAELSFRRLDKANASFATNYYQNLIGKPLGHGPKKISQNYLPYEKNSSLQILLDEGLKAMEAETMQEREGGGYVDKQFIYDVSIPRPDFMDYKVTGVNHYMGSYREIIPGMLMQNSSSYFIAEDKMTVLFHLAMPTQRVFEGKNHYSPYGGKFSPLAFPAYNTPDGQGYATSDDYYLFDETAGRFVRCVARGALVKVDGLGEYSGYKMQYGLYTSDKNYCIAVLNNGTKAKGLYLKLPGKAGELTAIPYTLVGEVDIPQDILNEKSICQMMDKTPHLMVATGSRLFKCNVKNWEMGTVPGLTDCVKTLQDYGYSGEAEITCMFVSRSQKSILLGVSRYGGDLNGSSEELKGDVLVIDAETYELKDSYKGVCGYPADILVKYQTFYKDGKDKNGILKDNI